MDKYVVTGARRLEGKVRVDGAKNATLPILAATVLTEHECVIREVPRLRDVWVMMEILSRLGARVRSGEDESGRPFLAIDTSSVNTFEITHYLSREMRSSIFLMGPLLGRLGKVRVAYPGGCAIGPRPINLHLRGLELMGAQIDESHGYIEAKADRLKGTEIHLDFPSVGATENIMMAAVLAKGTTVIRNAAKEPEIVDLQGFLNSLGARIAGAGTDTIRVEGVDSLRGAGHTVIPDRIEAGTFMIAAAITGGDVRIQNVIPEHLQSVVAKLRETGAHVEEGASEIRVRAAGSPKATNFITLPYPGFPTDLQPQAMALMCIADGTSVLTETIFAARFRHADELCRMGADIRVEGSSARVVGRSHLTGATVEAPSLREGAALVLAGLAAEGSTVVEGVHHIDRGYDSFEEKLRGLGANIRRVSTA